MSYLSVDPMVTNIIERIRLLYKTCEERLLPVPWSEDFSFHLNDIFTRLKIVSKEKTRGTLTDDITNMTGIFKEHEDCQKPRIVLIEGEPGMGKTTYCQKLAYDWATKQGEWDQSFPNTEVLLFLRCHDIKSNIWEAINDQILPEDIDEEAKESFNKFIRQNQSKVLLVLDGLDEVDRSKLAMCSKIVESKELSDCHIILTSRHEAGKTVRRYCDTLWEIVGFTEKDAQNFIRKYFRNMENLAKKLITLLFGQHLCLYGYDSDYDTDEETDYYWDLDSYSDCDTNQYSHLRELTKNPLNTVLLCVLFEDFEGVLPTNRTQLYIEIVLCVLRRYEEKNGLSSKSEDLIAVYRKELVLLGSTALLSLRKGELSCEEHEFGCDFSLLIKFGFLSVQTCGSQRKPFMRCAFLHKSFQEFFSGLYLAFQVLDGEMDCYSVVTDERYLDELNQVFLFMSGIVASQCEESALSLVKSTAAHINLLRRISCDKANLYLQFACDFISECQEKLQPRLFRNFYEQLDLSSLTNLNLHGNSFGATVATFLSQVLTATSSLTSLNLSGNSIGATGTASLSQALAANSSVTNLNLSENSIGATGAASLSQALTANCSLTNLNLSWNSIDATGAASLSQALEANASLTHLNLSWNSIGDTGAASLSQALTENSSLTNLDLSYNSIGATGAASLSQGLTANSSLTDLNLCENNIGDDGAYSLSEALTTNSSLTSLDLSGNGISETGVDFLSNVLIQNSSLSHLDLSENEISTDGIRLLSGVLRINTTVHVIL